MVISIPRYSPILCTAVFVSSLLVASLTGCFAEDQDPAGKKLNLKTDSTPLERDQETPLTSYASVIEKVTPSIVNVFSTRVVESDRRQLPFLRRFFDRDDSPEQQQKRRQQSLGSGVIISEDGYALTNHHVVKQAEEIRVALSESERELPAELIGSDPKTDLAVLKIQSEEPLPVATLGDSSNIKVGDITFAIGNPFGVGQTVTKGIVSAKSRGIGMLDYEKFIQTDASINPGNSGGALVDAKGRVIGINTVIMSRSGGSQGVGFSIPINLARSIATSIVEEGKVSRGFLGVNIQEITPELKKAFDLKRDSGVLISGVMDGLPAEKAGLKRGDVIVSFDGQPVEDVRDLQFAVAQTSPSTEVSVGIVRDGNEKTVQLTLAERPGDEQLSDRTRSSEPGQLEELGLSLTPITPQLRRRQEIPENVDGLVVTGVKPGSNAATAGIRTGDVIAEINRKSVKSLSEARNALKAGPENMALVYLLRNGSGQYITVKRD